MVRLLDSGNISYLDHVYDAELDIYGDMYAQISHDNPDYENLIPFLPPDQKERAREIFADARLKKAAKA